MRCAPKTEWSAAGSRAPRSKHRKTHRPHGFQSAPFVVVACDTVVRLRDGLRRYMFTFIDPVSRFAVAFASATASSRQASIALAAVCEVLPAPPRFVLSDNGSEFMGAFDQSLTCRITA